MTTRAGTGAAYANYRGAKLNTTFLDRAGFGFNWDASFPWEVLGTPFATANATRAFETCTPHSFRGAPGGCDGCDPTLPTACYTLSYAEANGWYEALAAQGNYTTLTYFNVFELGQDILALTAPPKCSMHGHDLEVGLNIKNWTKYVDCKYNALVQGELRSAVVRCWNDEAPSCPRQGPNGSTTGLVQSAFNALVMDPAVAPYHAHVVEQAKRLVSLHPNPRVVGGVAIDRSDWSGLVNPDRDDGLTSVDGLPGASLLTSFISITNAVAAVLHGADRVLLLNDEIYRGDMLGAFDGIYDEYGDLMDGRHAVASAFLGLSKPVYIWFHDSTYPWGDRDPVTDSAYRIMLQNHLLLGCFPSVPFVECDHCLNTLNSTVPEDVWRSAFESYGPLFQLLRGRQWVLHAHALNVTGARGNVFFTHGGGAMVVPVVLGAGNAQVRLRVPTGRRVVAVQARRPSDDALHAGVTWSVNSAGTMLLAPSVTLGADGCVVLVVTLADKTAMKSDGDDTAASPTFERESRREKWNALPLFAPP